MKSSSRLGDISQRLQEYLRVLVLMILTVARSPQLYLDLAWDASRKYLFSVIFISLVVSKCFHIFVHLKSLRVLSLFAWGPTFFLVDIILILIACRLARSFTSRIARDITAVVTLLFSFVVSSMLSANISYYLHLGVEIHWRKSKRFHQDSPSFLFVLSTLTVAILVDASVLIIAYFLTPHLFRATNAFLDIWTSILPARLRCSRRETSPSHLPDPEVYEQVAFEDYDENDDDDDSVTMLDTVQESPKERNRPFFIRALIIGCSSVLLLFSLTRPRDLTYSFLSESLPFARFYGPGYLPFDESIAALSGDFSWLGNHTALDTFPEFDWLQHSAEGPSPWSPLHENTYNLTLHKSLGKYWQEHYNPLKDPLHIQNLGNDILESIKQALHSGDVKIKHIVLVKLESTRQDVWPFRTSSYIMDHHIKNSYHGSVPRDVEARLSNLTHTAERLTGFQTGFENSDRPKPYGGISASNAYTSGTYTMKSITGTVCGLNPMAVEKNLEYYHDFYQPCMPHIFEALNKQPNITSDTEDWTLWPWHTSWMQTHYGTWDRQERLTPALGYSSVLTKESINATGNKYIPEEDEREYHYGHEDKLANNYMRDLFADAKKNNTRVFLTHLTHNTHTPWFIPGDYESYMELIGGYGHGRNQKINAYLNTIHYQDEWIGDILQILEDAEVADETLLIMAGDHGISLPNDGGITANHDPHVGNFHVPLFFSHPKIPQIEVSDPVISTQILPTLLDLLIETASMDESSTKILKDLLPLYEGQSMIRPLIPAQDDRQEWHFSTMNPGGTWISMRAAPDPYRLVVPLVPEAPWRFSDVVADPFELHVEEDYDLLALIDVVQTRYGPEAAKWLNKAAHVAQWWIKDNHRRWGYDPEVEQEGS